MRRRAHARVEANPFVVLSDLFIALSFLLCLLLIAVALSSSSALEQLEVTARQEAFQARVAAHMPDAYRSGLVEFASDGNLQRISFSTGVLFEEGRWQLQPRGRRLLAQFAPLLRWQARQGNLRMALVEGHTDTTPMHPNLVRRGVRSSWDLSLLRSVEVTRYLQRQGVPPGLLGAAGRGEWSPRAANRSEAGRARNRRVEVVLVYQSARSDDGPGR